MPTFPLQITKTTLLILVLAAILALYVAYTQGVFKGMSMATPATSSTSSTTGK